MCFYQRTIQFIDFIELMVLQVVEQIQNNLVNKKQVAEKESIIKSCS